MIINSQGGTLHYRDQLKYTRNKCKKIERELVNSLSHVHKHHSEKLLLYATFFLHHIIKFNF